MPAVRVQKLESTDGFLAIDLDGAPTAVGITRVAPKILREGAELLARSVTYTCASYGLQLSGGSAGINAKPDHRDAAVAAYVEEVKPLVAGKQWLTSPGLGLTEADLTPLRANDPRPSDLWMEGLEAELTGRGAVAAADAAVGGLQNKRVTVVGSGPVAAAASDAARIRGGHPSTGELDADTDVVLVAGKSGVVDHEAAEAIKASAVVALTPLPVTAKAYAVLSRAGKVYVPDFLALAAPLLHAFSDDADPVERVHATTGELAVNGVELWRAGIDKAEAFLRTWRDDLPFGRPLA